jgi:hypothetical protein
MGSNLKYFWNIFKICTKKKTIMTDDVGNPGPGLGQAQKCGRVKPGNGKTTLPF